MNDKIRNMIKEYYEEGDFIGPQPLDRILEIERLSHLNFPEQYREYISYFGSGGICGVEIKGIESENSASVIQASKRSWDRGLNRKYIVIYDIGDLIYCMNADDTSINSPVYSWVPFNQYSEPHQDYSTFDQFIEDYFQEGIDNW